MALLLQGGKIAIDSFKACRSFRSIAFDIGAEAKVLLNRHGGKGFLSLRHLHQTPPHDAIGSETIDTLTIEGHRPAPGPKQSRGRLEKRGFARAIAAEQ